LLLETDAPFQTLKNENMTSPLEIRRVYQAALEIRRRENPLLSMDELQRALSCNFLRVFDMVEK
ncbi:MAG: TatD family hydrolase, partial [Treponema porcinum]|nr:TatD family hydrolase [Treponema porcinum]